MPERTLAAAAGLIVRSRCSLRVLLLFLLLTMARVLLLLVLLASELL
jgi:hypothetical protein